VLSQNKTSVLVCYRRIKYRYEFGCGLAHSCFNYTHPNEYGYFTLL